LFEKDYKKQDELYQNDNEIDVFFIYKNNPYLVETKSSIGKEKINTKSLNEYLFKLSVVKKRFGIWAKATIITLSDFSTMGDNAKFYLKRKCKILEIFHPLDREIIINFNKFKDELNKFLK